MTDAIEADLLIFSERARQDVKWGEQNHDDPMWLVILMEEVGEAAKEIFEGNEDKAFTELVQVAAVAMAWVECKLRAKGP